MLQDSTKSSLLSSIKNPWSLAAWIVLCYLLLRAAFLYSPWLSHKVLTWDVFAFYLYLPAVFIYDDLANLEFVESVRAAYSHFAVSGYASALPDGGYVMKTSMGMSILYLPFFAVAHWLAPSLGYPADGFSVPYQFAISISGVFYVCMGLWFSRKILLRFFPDHATAIALLAIALGTNLLFQASFKGALAHGPLFGLFALLLWLTIRWHEQPKVKWAAALGFVFGLIVLARPTDMILALIPLLWGVGSLDDLESKWNLLREKWLHILILLAATIFVGMWQVVYWKAYSGDMFYYSYDEQGFDFLHPNLFNGLLSWHKGWLIYTPMMLLSLLGFIPLYKKNKRLFWPIAIFFALNYWIVFSWIIWDYGGGFSARALVESYAILMIPFAAMIAWLMSKKWSAILGIIFILLCTDLNLMMHWQVTGAEVGINTGKMNSAFYWRIFGSTQAVPDDRKLLDAPHQMGSTAGMAKRVLYFNDYENDTTANRVTTHHHSGQYSCRVDPEHAYSPNFTIRADQLKAKSGSWLRIKVSVLYAQREWDPWNQPKMSCQFERDGKGFQSTGVQIYRLAGPWAWHELVFEKRVPKDLKPDDLLKAWFSLAPSNKQPVWIDDMQVEIWEK